MGLRDYVKQISPPWLVGPGNGSVLPAAAGVAERFMYSLAFGLDALAQKVEDAIKMRFPSIGDPSSLPQIGNDRQIVRGIGESDASYSTRLNLWLDTWRLAGEARGVLEVIAGFVQVEPRIMSVMVSPLANKATWYFLAEGDDYNAAPTKMFQTPINWVWDTDSFVKRKWIVIDAGNFSIPNYWVADSGFWGMAGLNYGDDLSIAMNRPPSTFATLRDLAKRWQSADTRTQWIVINYLSGMFDQYDPPGSASLPDATWAHWSKIDTASTPARPIRIPSRSQDAWYVAVQAPW
jgi:hypothetical protein